MTTKADWIATKNVVNDTIAGLKLTEAQTALVPKLAQEAFEAETGTSVDVLMLEDTLDRTFGRVAQPVEESGAEKAARGNAFGRSSSSALRDVPAVDKAIARAFGRTR